MPTNSLKGLKIDPTPMEKRRGIKISDRAQDEYFRPVKLQTTVRLDADVVAWLKSKGTGHISRINKLLRQAMQADS